MKYNPPFGSTDPNAAYVDRNTPGAVQGSAVPAAALEHVQREVVEVIRHYLGATAPSSTDLTQLRQAMQAAIASVVTTGPVLLGMYDRPVSGWVATPPSSAAEGAAYIVKPNGSGAWLNKDEQLALRTATGWTFVTPKEGLLAQIVVGGVAQVIVYEANAWRELIATATKPGLVTLNQLNALYATDDENDVSSLTDNGDGTFTHAAGGVSTTFSTAGGGFFDIAEAATGVDTAALAAAPASPPGFYHVSGTRKSQVGGQDGGTASFLVQAKFGGGWVTISTFDVTNGAGSQGSAAFNCRIHVKPTALTVFGGGDRALSTITGAFQGEVRQVSALNPNTAATSSTASLKLERLTPFVA